MRRLRVIVIVAAAITAVACLGAAASLAATKPPGYVRVLGSVEAVPPGSFVLPSLAKCPAGKVIWAADQHRRGCHLRHQARRLQDRPQVT